MSGWVAFLMLIAMILGICGPALIAYFWNKQTSEEQMLGWILFGLLGTALIAGAIFVVVYFLRNPMIG